jgi:hypothetical protein
VVEKLQTRLLRAFSVNKMIIGKKRWASPSPRKEASRKKKTLTGRQHCSLYLGV